MTGVNGSGGQFRSIYGVDFSGAKLAGRNIWVARLEPVSGKSRDGSPVRRGPHGRGREGAATRFRLAQLDCLEKLAGTAERERALRHLVQLIRQSEDALWAMDFPFSLPIEVRPAEGTWPDQLAFLRRFGDDAYAVGLDCLERARKLGGPLHIRRQTDLEARTPFDCYHYRIIYQFVYGARDVLGPLWDAPRTATLPFQYRRLGSAKRVLVEACPSSTLKRLGLPHQNYKQPGGGPLLARRLRTRHAILGELASHVRIDPPYRRTMMRNPGGDAIDAVLAAVGAAQAWHLTDHRAVARHPRYPREGMLYV